MSGTDPKGKNFSPGDPTRQFQPDDPGQGSQLPPDLPKVPGITLQYEIARGGMGVVYSGRQDFLDRRVAVKFLSVELGGASFAQRFQREAKILAGIKHPNIVACHMADTTDDGQSYLVMEFIDGPSLKAWVADNGPTSALAALRLTRATAQALSYANQLDVIHRDVKPENILLETMTSTSIDVAFPFTPKLVDLGLARMTHEQVGMGLTSPGSVMGTPATMSPEQFDDPDTVDFRSDIYGLGCCLYEMLVGHPAFRGNRLTDIVTRKRAPLGPNPCDENKLVAPAVGALTQRMLACNRDDRPSSYKELDDLIGELMKVLSASGDLSDTIIHKGTDQTAATLAVRPGQLPPPVAPAGSAPPPSKPPGSAKPSGPGLLRTAELDFLSEDGGTAGEAATPAFRDGTSGISPSGTGPGAMATGAKKSRGPLIVVGAVAVIAAGIGVWLGTRPGDPGKVDPDTVVDAGRVVDAGPGKVATNRLPVVEGFDGPKNVDLGVSFWLKVTASDPDGEEVRYAWQWPEGVLPASGTAQSSVKFQLMDGLPGIELVFKVEVLDHTNDPVMTTHTIVVGKCPDEQPLIGFESKAAWQMDKADRAWREKTDPLDRQVSCRARKALRTMTTDLGSEAYWEWFGSLESNDDMETDYATLGLRFEFGDAGYAVQCTRKEDGALWAIEVMERAGEDWRPLPKRSVAEWRQPAGTADEYRGWFSVKRQVDRLTLQVGEFRQSPPANAEAEFPEPVMRLQKPVSFPLPDGVTGGKLTLFTDQGIGRFRVRRR